MYEYEIHRDRSAELRRSAEEYRLARSAAPRRARRRRAAGADGTGGPGGAAARRGSWVKAA
ncbi:hypothetical protein O7599_10155 [Streptomyces sp. WMMC500]|uniref:hypothetical protein n=1 Tax=Streptomyces sp. WMMC500 TaxID=3015154 RepID=UPI00248C31FA|nr:hypothetical protein [Streptomyces sp. WMMC500]WBB62859.1 hypothetical protein O7599_10155 [Streptomyces sp. WMMC500]